MGWFWADTSSDIKGKCPVNHGKSASKSIAAGSVGGGCPVDHGSAKEPAKCPIEHDGEINPLNNMPNYIPSSKLKGQQLDLPTERTISTIPRGESGGFWEYPSPQQMFNAMVRKGKDQGIPEDAVESMVDVHNFLNEGAWEEILEWEEPYSEKTKTQPRLKKFTGKPNQLSPRAQMYIWLAKIFPDRFQGEPPFDRHDWTVLRSTGGDFSEPGNWKEVRYVIDYYGGPEGPDGVPSFFLDVRPALDGPVNALDRFNRWSGPIISKALGASRAEE